MANRCHVYTQNSDGTDRQHVGCAGHVGNLKYSYADPGGPIVATFTLAADPEARPRALIPGRDAFIVAGGQIVFPGILAAPKRGLPWQCQIDGAAGRGQDFRATNNVDLPTMLADANTRGLGWTIPAGLPVGVGAGPATSLSNSVTEILNGVAGGLGQTWWLDTSKTLHVAAPPTTPTVLFTSQTAAGGRALAGYVTAYRVTWIDSGTGAWRQGFRRNTAAEDKFPQVEAELDLTGRGAMTAAQATALADGRLSLYGPRAPWAGPFVFADGQVLNLGGVPIDLPFVTAPVMGRLTLTDPDHAAELSYPSYTDLRVGVTEYDDEAGTLTVTPYDIVQSTLAARLRRRQRAA